MYFSLTPRYEIHIIFHWIVLYTRTYLTTKISKPLHSLKSVFIFFLKNPFPSPQTHTIHFTLSTLAPTPPSINLDSCQCPLVYFFVLSAYLLSLVVLHMFILSNICFCLSVSLQITLPSYSHFPANDKFYHSL